MAEAIFFNGRRITPIDAVIEVAPEGEWCAACAGRGVPPEDAHINAHCEDCGGSGLVPQPPLPETDESRFAQRMRERRVLSHEERS